METTSILGTLLIFWIIGYAIFTVGIFISPVSEGKNPLLALLTSAILAIGWFPIGLAYWWNRRA